MTIRPGRLDGSVVPPPSKSYAQRALAAALLCPGQSTLRNIGSCDDTRAALRTITALGAEVHTTDAGTLTVRGGLFPRGRHLHVGESGLAARLFTPIAALTPGTVSIEGRGSLLERPMSPATEALNALGARAEDRAGRLPIVVRGPLRGGVAELDGSLSSQFLTGLLMALPCAEADTTLRVRNAVSTPYLDMTIATAEAFSVAIHQRDYTEFYIPGRQRYRPAEFTVEGDWSAAAMLLAAGATAGRVTVRNLDRLSRQADAAVVTALVRSGAALVDEGDRLTAAERPLRAFEFDATHCPDLFPALAVLAAAAEGVSALHGVARLRHKESDRAEAIRTEFGRMGIGVELADEDTMLVRGGRPRAARVRSHDDHRIAMALALLALRADSPTTIDGAECVTKSYPRFFEELERLRA